MPRPLRPVLGLVPARGGSKGLPGKNLRPLAGRPLVAHAVACGLACQDLTAVVCSTDDEEIAAAAVAAGARVPSLRAPELSLDTTPMWPVVRHALELMCRIDQVEYGSVLLLDPTSPGRLPEDVAAAVLQMESVEGADAVVGVSALEPNPIWYAVVERDGWMTDLVPEGKNYTRRQEVPPCYRINGMVYLWRADFVRSCDNWREGRTLMQVVPSGRAFNIDTIDDFRSVEAALETGSLDLPWLR